MNRRSSKGGQSSIGRRVRQALLAAAVVVGCGGMAGKPTTGGESHFLEYCKTKCASGLDCIAGVCTRGCLVGQDGCEALNASAHCTDGSIEPGEVAVCDVSCDADEQCASLGRSHECVDGYCRGEQPDPSLGPGSCRVAYRSYPSGSTDVPAPNGCGRCTCNAGELSCTDANCAAGAPIVTCPESVETDSLGIYAFYISGDTLSFGAGHGGGCARHDYALCYEQEVVNSSPPSVTLRLIHDAHGERCDGFIEPELRFDLRPLARWLSGADPAELDRGERVSTPFGLYSYGRFTCEDRGSIASVQAQAAAAAIVEAAAVGLGCRRDSDCQFASIDTACSAACGAIMSPEGAPKLEAALASINTGVCRDFAGDGCDGPFALPCIPPNGEPACVNGKCEIAPR